MMHDFIDGTYEPTDGTRAMKGIASSLSIKGKGRVRFEVIDSHGVTQVIKGPALHTAELPCRLLPPQKVFNTDKEGHYRINGEGGKFVFANNRGIVNTPFDNSHGLPAVTSFKSVDVSERKLDTVMYACVTEETNQNLSPSQREASRWHWRLGHPGMKIVQWLAKQNLLGTLSSKIAKVNETPLCATCQHGKQVCKTTGTLKHVERPDKTGGIMKDKLLPGKEVAVDQFEVIKHGRLFKTGGKEKEHEQYSCGTIFVDVATGFTRVYFQVSTGAEETIKSKNVFERDALSYGVVIQNYRTDNGTFTKENFMK